MPRRWGIWKEYFADQAKQEALATAELPVDEDGTSRRYMPFDRVALVIYRCGFWLAPSWLFIDTRKRRIADAEQKRKTLVREEWETAGYVMVWLLLLTAALVWSPKDGTIAKVIGALALFRLFEIAVAVLGFVLDQREPKIARSLITISVMALQVALIFAILDHSFARNGFLQPDALTSGRRGVHAAETPFEYLYLSWTYMTTVGNAYTPKSEVARILELAANTSGILLLGIVAARAIGLVSETKKLAVGLEDRVAGIEQRMDDPPPPPRASARTGGR